jgi:cytochrome c-type biogenesis protein CcmF
MAVGPLLSWKRGDLPDALARLKFALGAAVATVAATWLAAGVSSRSLWASLGLGLAAWLLAGSLTEWAGRVRLFRSSFAESLHRALHLPRSSYGMTIGHMGLAVLLIGVAGSLAWQTEYLQVMRPGAAAAVAGYQVKFIGVEDNVKGPNYIASRASFIVTKNGRTVAELQPERRMFANPPQPLSTVAIHTNFVSDLYAVLGDPDGKGGFVVHIYHNPLVPWIFFGAVMMVLGGMVSLTDRHHRIGAPLRRLAAKISIPAKKVAAPSAAAADRRKSSPGWMYILPLLAFAVLAGFFLYRLHLVEEGVAPNLIPSVLIDRPTPAFDLPPLLAGERGFKTADLKGKVTLVNFFASWCVPCRLEHPILQQVAKAGIVLVGINYKDRPEDAKAWLAEMGNPYRIVAVDAHGRTGIDFGVYGVPESYLIDKQGVIRFKQPGPLTPEIINNQLVPLAEKLGK